MSHAFRRLALIRLAKSFDLVLVSFVFLVAFALSSHAATWSNLADVFAMRIAIGNALIFAVYLALCSVIFTGCGIYRSHRLSLLTRRIRELLLAVTLIAMIFLLLRGPLDLSFASNRFLLIFWLLTFAALMLSHETALGVLHYARARGRNLRNIVIVGELGEATALAERFEKESTFGYRVLQIIDPGEPTK